MAKSGYQNALELARKVDPFKAAQNCEFQYVGESSRGEFRTILLNQQVVIKFPEFQAYFFKSEKEINPFIMTFILYHLATSDGTSLSNDWISYADLPDGQFYVQAMRGYTAEVLVKYFKNDKESINKSMDALKLEEVRLSADFSYKIQFLPKVLLLFQYSLGDEELTPHADFLFDKSAAHHLPSDCYAVLCSWLTKCLIQGKYLY